jgi:hypothetical protein
LFFKASKTSYAWGAGQRVVGGGTEFLSLPFLSNKLAGLKNASANIAPPEAMRIL